MVALWQGAWQIAQEAGWRMLRSMNEPSLRESNKKVMSRHTPVVSSRRLVWLLRCALMLRVLQSLQ